jgi:hypothetical protein
MTCRYALHKPELVHDGGSVHSCKAFIYTAHLDRVPVPARASARTSSIARAAVDYPSEVRSQSFSRPRLVVLCPIARPLALPWPMPSLSIDKGRRGLGRAAHCPKLPPVESQQGPVDLNLQALGEQGSARSQATPAKDSTPARHPTSLHLRVEILAGEQRALPPALP